MPLLPLISGVLRLDPGAYAQALEMSSWWTPMVLLILSGASITIGQIGILLANRVTRFRLFLSILLAMFLFVAGVLFWAISIRFIASILFGQEQSLQDVFLVVTLAHTPLVFGFFVLLPYLGILLHSLLRIWIFVTAGIGVSVLYEFQPWQALLCCILGAVLMEFVTRLPLLRIERLQDWLWRITTGKTQLLGSRMLAENHARVLSPLDPNIPPGQGD